MPLQARGVALELVAQERDVLCMHMTTWYFVHAWLALRWSHSCTVSSLRSSAYFCTGGVSARHSPQTQTHVVKGVELEVAGCRAILALKHPQALHRARHTKLCSGR